MQAVFTLGGGLAAVLSLGPIVVTGLLASVGGPGPGPEPPCAAPGDDWP